MDCALPYYCTVLYLYSSTVPYRISTCTVRTVYKSAYKSKLRATPSLLLLVVLLVAVVVEARTHSQTNHCRGAGLPYLRTATQRGWSRGEAAGEDVAL